ncbi:MAG: DNA repair protein RecO [Acetobacteraceae bacterium]
MDWDAPAIVLEARPYGEGDALASVFTEAHGVHRGLARGGGARGRTSLWQPGNLAHVRWVARLADQLGSFTAELVHPAAALAMDDPLALATLSGACAVAVGALPERVAHPRVFQGLLRLIAGLSRGTPMIADLVRWEAAMLADLGYGLDLAACAVTGATESLTHVSPRSGRAVSEAGVGAWRERLLVLPGFLLDAGDEGCPADWAAGLRLTGHFLARDAFGLHHKPLPPARGMLYDRVAALETPNAG